MHGASNSVIAALFMTMLFMFELSGYLSTQSVAEVSLDDTAEPTLRINFNVTMMDLPCDYAVVDVVDLMGTNRMNITKNIEKWQLDENGVRRVFQGRNKEQKDILHDEHHGTLEELHENGEHAYHITTSNYDEFLNENDWSFLNFYAPWCVWCQRLEPTWEAFAELVEEQEVPIKIVKVNCVEDRQLCNDNKIQAFPTLRLFKKHEAQLPDYKLDRTTTALMDYVKAQLEKDEKYKDWPADRKKRRDNRKPKQEGDHPGCQLSGYLLVNRVPGNFHIEARSKSHNLNAQMTNLSHIVNHLSFGSPLRPELLKRLNSVPEAHVHVHPLDNNVYVNEEFHSAHHHYLKVVPTNYELGKAFRGKDTLLSYQVLTQNQLMHYDEFDVPEARFSYDLSPMAISVSRKSKKLYEFMTSLCAIIGGTFTVMGLFDGAVHKLLKKKTL